MHAQPTHAHHRPDPAPPAAPESPPQQDRHAAAPAAGRRDLLASAAVVLAAVPLSLGVALATGAPLQAGLVAAGIGGVVAALLGGAPPRIGGIATGLVLVTAELVQRYGWAAACTVVALAGLAQLALGAGRVARGALAVSPAVVRGMLAGIGVTIALAQVRVVLGGSPGDSVPDHLAGLPGELLHPHAGAVAIGAVTVTVLLGWRRLPGRAGQRARTVPAPLAAVGLATAASTALPAPRISLPHGELRALPVLPDGPVLGIAAAVLTVTLVASLEWLLAAVAAERLRADRPDVPGRPARLDRELAGQGAAEVLSGLLGGLPVAGARRAEGGRASRVPHGAWVLACTALFTAVLERIPLAAPAALVMTAGVRMACFARIRHVRRHREFPLYAATFAAVVLLGILQGVAVGVAVTAFLSLRRLAHTRITVEEADGRHAVRVSGQLTYLAIPRLSRALAQVPEGANAVVELGGAVMDHAAYDTLQSWSNAHRARGGWVTLRGARRQPVAEPASSHVCRPWTPWRDHRCTRPTAPHDGVTQQLLGGVGAFQRDTAPLVRDELARLAREGQRPTQLFLTCADSRLVTSMITSSGPGDLFTVRNVGNLMPPPGADTACDSVAAAVEYAVEVLRVGSITVCGHSGCGAMQALLSSAGQEPDRAGTPLARWLAHGRPTLARMQRIGRLGRGEVALADRPVADDLERLALVNVVQQLDHLMAHACVARRVAEGSLRLHGMYFHVAEAQAYVLDRASRTFAAVRPEVLGGV
ncbi:carbonic anhydrase [Streptomyces gamaensis]|uniref:carbonic anhydrase n=1 Tax=Streptomyces gamaensis TaxID=1763542 RepID=A0ABW0Z6F1_9ACTN